MSGYKLDTGKKYIYEIFSEKHFFNVPDYQRPYVWGDDQVNALLNDLYNAFKNNNDKEYFIGCMIWNEKRSREGESFASYDILDGQQRFLTSYLLHSVFRDVTTDDNLKDEVESRLREKGSAFKGIPCRNRIIFEIRDDHVFLEEFILKRNGTLEKNELTEISQTGESVSKQNLANAVLVMHKWFNNLQKEIGVDDFQEEISGFFTFFSSKVLALYLATPDSLDDAYNLFTVLNSRGMQLQISDILRARNLREIKDDDLRKLYAEEWDNYVNKINEPYNSFDDFLYTIIYIIMKYNSDDNDNLQKAFDFLEKRGRLKKGVDTFDLIGKYINHYQEIVSGKLDLGDDTNIFNNIVLMQNKFCGANYLMPLMHYKEFFGLHGIVDFLIKLDNLISLGWMLGHRYMTTRYFILMRKIEEYGLEYQRTNAPELIEKALNCDELRLDFKSDKANVFLDIYEFHEMIQNEKWGSFNGTKVNKTRYLLFKLDFILSGHKSKLTFNKQKCSVEHLMPMHMENFGLNVEKEQHDNWLHKLGNIILLDARKNARLNKSSFSIKKEKYELAVKNRIHSNNILSSHGNWNIETIKNNQAYIFELLKNYYQINSLQYFR